MSISIQRILDDFQTDSDADRINSYSDRMDIYLDDYETQIREILKKQFTPENFKVLHPMIARHDNVFKKIVNLKSQIYKDEPTRLWFKADGKTVDEQYADVIGKSNIAASMVTIEKFMNVNNVSLARIVMRNGRIEYDPVQGECIQVEQDDENPMEYNALVHEIFKNNTRNQQGHMVHIWTNGKSKIFDNGENGKGTQTIIKIFPHNNLGIDPTPETDTKPNPYIDPTTDRGIIPYTDFRIFDGIDFWNETMNEDLRIGTLQINADETHTNNLIKFSGYRQVAIVGKIDEANLHNAKTDVLAILNVKPEPGTDVSISTLDHVKDPNEMIEAIAKKTAIMASNHGVSFNAEAISSRQRQTAEALTINQEQIIALREERIPILRLSEKEMAWKTVIIANTPTNMSGLGTTIDMAGKFKMDYPEVEVVTDSEKTQKVDLVDITEGFLSRAQYLMKRNPDIKSEEEAIKLLEHIAEVNAETANLTDAQLTNNDEIIQAAIKRPEIMTRFQPTNGQAAGEQQTATPTPVQQANPVPEISRG